MTVKIRLIYDAFTVPFSAIKGGQFFDEMARDLMCSYGAARRLSNWSACMPMAF
jgi:hypothetical protein